FPDRPGRPLLAHPIRAPGLHNLPIAFLHHLDGGMVRRSSLRRFHGSTFSVLVCSTRIPVSLPPYLAATAETAGGRLTKDPSEDGSFLYTRLATVSQLRFWKKASIYLAFSEGG